MENAKDRFYVDLQNDTIEWMYYNPDSNTGGQFVLCKVSYKDSEDSRDFRVKVAEFEIGKEQAAKYIKKTQMGHHLKLNMWKDIKVRVFI